MQRSDPLEAIWNTTQIRAVVANGRYFNHATPDALCAQAAHIDVDRLLVGQFELSPTERMAASTPPPRHPPLTRLYGHLHTNYEGNSSMRYGPGRSHGGRATFNRWFGRGASALTGAAVLALVGAVPATASVQQRTSTRTSLVFDGVTVVDVETGKLVPGQRVLITGTRIEAVGAASAIEVPTGAQVVNARGKYLIPGLWDMHVHGTLAPAADSALIAEGVTGIRDMAVPDFDSLREKRKAIALGVRIGPRVVATTHDFAGPMCDPTRPTKLVLDGGGGWLIRSDSEATDTLSAEEAKQSMCLIDPHTVRFPEEARRIVDSLKKIGVDFIKIHMLSDPNVFFAIIAEARRVGLPVAGHLGGHMGRAATEFEASDSGMRSIEHIVEMGCWTGWATPVQVLSDSITPLPDSLEETRCQDVAATFARNKTWLVPTLAIFNEQYKNRKGNVTAQSIAHAVTVLHRLGTPMLAGTDAAFQSGGSHAISIHDELAALVGAGFTPIDALRTATRNAAEFLGQTDSLGIVAAGRLADLVLLDADPLADITNTVRIRAVVANGRYFDRAALDALLAGADGAARKYAAPTP